ncbi:hypothetical protein HYT45_02430 [Candidatus Uhrbacteria bacterium]|nr:hypothetical protein [Candidatus Uhrbacteria bacterium]
MFSAILQVLRQPLLALVAGVMMGTVGTVSVVTAPEPPSPPSKSTSNIVAQVRLAQEVTQCSRECNDTVSRCLSEAGEDQEKISSCRAESERCLASCATVALPPPAPPPAPENTGPKDEQCLRSCADTRTRCDQSATDETAVGRCEEALNSCKNSCPAARTQTNQPGGGQYGPPGGGQYGPPEGGQFGQPGGEGQYGSSPEEFEKQQKEQEARAVKDAKRQFTMFLRDLKRFKTEINRVRAKKIAIPQEVEDAVKTIESSKEKIASISTIEELMELGDTLQEAAQVLNDRIPDLLKLAEYPRIRKQAQSQVNRMESQLRRMQNRAKAAKVDVAELASEMSQLIDEVKSALSQADAARDAGDADTAFEALEGGVFERIDEVQERLMAFEMVVRAPQEITRVSRELKQMDALVRRLERQKKDVTAIKEILSQMKAKFTELKTLIATKPLPIEELIAGVEEFEDLRDQFQDEANKLQGIEEELVKEGPRLELPSGIPTRRPPAGPELEE